MTALIEDFFSDGTWAAAAIIAFVIAMVFVLDWVAQWWERPAVKAVILALLLAPSASAQDIQWASWSLSETLIKQGEDQKVLFGARFAVKGPVWKARFSCRVEASATQDGGAVEGGVDLQNPNTFESVEGLCSVYHHFASWGAVAGLYGMAAEVHAGKLVIVERYPRSWGGGVRVGGLKGQWLYLLGGKHEASGSGFRILFSGSWPLSERVAVIGDGALLGGGGFARGGVSYLLGSSK